MSCAGGNRGGIDGSRRADASLGVRGRLICGGGRAAVSLHPEVWVNGKAPRNVARENNFRRNEIQLRESG